MPQPRIYTKDLARRVTFRLDDTLAEFVTRQAAAVGRSPSDWVRMVLHSYMHAVAGAVGLERNQPRSGSQFWKGGKA